MQTTKEIMEYTRQQIEHRAAAVKLQRSALARLRGVLKRIEACEHASDADVSADTGWPPHVWSVCVQIKKDHGDSPLVREIARALGAPFKKSVQFDKRGLRAEGAVGPINITVYNYLPSTCRVEYEDVMVPARMEKRAKVICEPAGEPPTEQQHRDGYVTVQADEFPAA